MSDIHIPTSHSGTYRGQPVRVVPTYYIQLLLASVDIEPELENALNLELEERRKMTNHRKQWASARKGRER